jgi:hypothetical protein
MSKISLFASAIAFGLTVFLSSTQNSHSMESEDHHQRFNFNPIVEKYTNKKSTDKTTNLEPFFVFALDKKKKLYEEVSSAFLEIKNGNFKNFDAVYGGNSCQVIAVFTHDVGREFEKFEQISSAAQKALACMYLTAEHNTFDDRGAFLEGKHQNYKNYKNTKFNGKGNIDSRLKSIKGFLGECIAHYHKSCRETKSFLNKNDILRTTAESGLENLMQYTNINGIPLYLKIITNQKPIILMFSGNKDSTFKGCLLTKEPKNFGFVIRAHAVKEFNTKEIENNFKNLLLEEAQNDDNEKIYGLEKKESRFFEVRHITGAINPFEGI